MPACQTKCFDVSCLFLFVLEHRRHDNATLLPQERFQLLSALGQNIEINNNVSLAFYISLNKNFYKMAADLDQCGQKEAAFVLYHKYLT